MSIEIPDLWGDDINVDVVPPLVILKTQAEAISRRTKGLLTADVLSASSVSSEGTDPRESHNLILTAPSLGYSESLLMIRHSGKRPYPVELVVPEYIVWLPEKRSSPRAECNDQESLLSAMAQALASPFTKATLHSLLARVNESRNRKREPITPPAGT